MKYGIIIEEFKGKIISISNHSDTNYRFDFKENDKMIYTVFVGRFMNVSIPDDVYNKWNPNMIMTKIN